MWAAIITLSTPSTVKLLPSRVGKRHEQLHQHFFGHKKWCVWQVCLHSGTHAAEIYVQNDEAPVKILIMTLSKPD